MEETVHRPIQEGWGEKGDIRRNEDARAYAEVVKEVGKEAGVAVLDAWGDFMKLTGWKGEDELPGSEKLGRNEVLAGLLPDGELDRSSFAFEAGFVLTKGLQDCI